MSAQPPVTPPQSPDVLPQAGYVPTTLFLVSGKKPNRDFRTALQAYNDNKENIPPPVLKRQDASLSEADLASSQILPEKAAQHHVDEKGG